MHTTPALTVPAEIEAELRAFATRIGVDRLAIARAEPFDREASLLSALAADGAYPPFTERDIRRRCDPQALLPGARAIVSIAVSYLTDDPVHPPRPDRRPRGWVSRYAWGRDYHRIVGEKLQRIAAFIEERIPGARCAPYVDTGPPIDRAVAQRAGLGWYGKNCCIYVPGFGSWVFLAEILTTAPLRHDPPVHQDCGSCDLCLRACPTGAIIAPYRIDSRRCLSYITQMPGFIPKEFRRAMGRRLWGCDVCQAVCPWNRQAVAANRPEFRPGGQAGRPDLIAVLLMSKSQFRQWFGHTAMAWRGKAVLQRNAAICLGNIGNPEAIPALVDRLLHDPKPVLRGSCAWALGQIGGPEAEAALLTARAREQDPEALAEIEEALIELSGLGVGHGHHQGHLATARLRLLKQPAQTLPHRVRIPPELSRDRPHLSGHLQPVQGRDGLLDHTVRIRNLSGVQGCLRPNLAAASDLAMLLHRYRPQRASPTLAGRVKLHPAVVCPGDRSARRQTHGSACHPPTPGLLSEARDRAGRPRPVAPWLAAQRWRRRLAAARPPAQLGSGPMTKTTAKGLRKSKRAMAS